MNLDKKTHPKLQDTIEKMCIDLNYGYPFFGEYNLLMNFINSTVHCSKCVGKGVIKVEGEEVDCKPCNGTGFAKSSIPTCAVNVTMKGMNFYWNDQFLDNLTQTEVTFVDIHELFHLIYNHPHRTVAGRLDPNISNIAQDMIINNTIWVDVMKKNKEHFFCQIPKYEKTPLNDERKLTGKNIGVFLPKEYTGDHVFEYLYVWLKEKHNEWKKKKEKEAKQNCKTCNGTGVKPQPNGQKPDPNGQGGQGNQPNNQQGQQGNQQGQQGNQQGQNGQGNGNQPDPNGQGGHGQGGNESCPDCSGKGQGGKGKGKGDGEPDYGNYGADGVDTFSLDSIFEMMDENEGQFMDMHIADEVPEEIREQMTTEAIERLRSRGLIRGDMEQVINKLRKKRKDFLREIKRAISNEIMGTEKKKSITKPNRRGIEGLKGNMKVKTKINVIIDTSGSMSGLHTKVLAYIYRNDIECNLIQCDTTVHSVEKIKKKRDLETIKLKGFGGTIIQPAFNLVVEKFNKYNTVLLTDGFTDSLDMSKVNGKVLVITTDNPCPISHKPKKGLKQIVVDEKYH